MCRAGNEAQEHWRSQAYLCLWGLIPVEIWPRWAGLGSCQHSAHCSLLPQAPLCNGSMVWSINLTTSMYCAARESLINITNCSVIQRTQRMLNALCPHKLSAKVSSEHVRDTKIEVTQFIKTLLQHSRNIFHYRSFNWSKKS
ncbi:interleukin-13 isoform X1 [Vicugna pacos]|uniref:Interleukin-13 n=1 Tax=Vicugna pacos TaxID=30538 RepID=A0A6J3A416_VICPA|nr:interleukin-13 isoform X1 [Vicugna pacos]